MTFPVVAGRTNSTQASGTSHTVALPASIASGNLLIFGFTTGFATSITTPAGWTRLSAAGDRPAIYYKTASGSEGASVVVTTSGADTSAHVSLRITGQDTGTAPEGANASGSSTNPDAPSLNPAGWGTEDTLWLAIAGNQTAKTPSGAPASYSNLNASAVAGSTFETASAERQLNAASEDPGVFTMSTSDWTAWTVAVRAVTVTVFTQSLSAALSFSGSLSKRTNKSMAGALSFSASLATGRALLKALSASLSFSGSLTRQTNKSMAGALSFVGALATLGIIADIKGLASAISSLIHQALSSNAAANSAAASDAEPGDATGGSS